MVEKMDDHAVYTKLNPHPPEMDVLPTTFFKPCLAAKWFCFIQVRPPTSSDNHLYLSLFYDLTIRKGDHVSEGSKILRAMRRADSLLTSHF